MATGINRRNVLRGALAGGVVGVGLPILNCMLNESGSAFASGTPLPVRFGTWFWGLGHTPNHAVVEKSATSHGIEFFGECQALAAHKDKINYLGKFNTPLDGRSNYPHSSGWIASRTGAAPDVDKQIPQPTYDLLIADKIGTANRFKTIDLSCTGNPSDGVSARNTYVRSAAEVSPASFYTRLFGAEFVDPNKAEFVPDPRTMLRKSVLSAVSEDRQKLIKQVGASDRLQLDEYFTSIRELERQLETQLQKPAPNEACQVMERPKDLDLLDDASGLEVDQVELTHNTMAKMLAMALACNQTNVFNMAFSASFSGLRNPGDSLSHHSLSHEERVDPESGIQPQTSYFNMRSMNALATFIETFESIQEGDGTLLDNVLIVAGSETSYAKTHSVDNIPFMTVGRAGGRIKTGMHVVGSGNPTTQIGYTAMQIMGLSLDKWGEQSLQTSKVISDILA